jgi:inosose dehydratase
MIRVANAPCSWGIIENITGGPADYSRLLDEMKQTGYAGTELGDWGFMPTDPAVLKTELDSRNLALLASWVSVFMQDQARHEESAAACVRTAKLLAAVGGPQALVVLGNDPYTDPMRTLYAGRLTKAQELTAEQMKIVVKGAQLIARRVHEETGLRTVLHHHVGTWIETPAETARFLEATDPKLVGLVFDTGHWTFAGGDAVEGIRKLYDRVWHVHFKDHEPEVARQSRVQHWDGPTSVGKGVFCELGKGSVDFRGVLKVLREKNYVGWVVVEQDVLPGMGTPKDNADRNRKYLKSIGLV